MKTALPLLYAVAALAASFASAQAPAKGYVVRADADTVWLDLTAADGAAPGRGFEVYTEGAELKHPVTGAVLGRVSETIAGGTISEVSDKFSTGRLSSRKSAVAVGERARLTSPVPTPASPAEPGTRAAKTRGATLRYAVNAMAVGDFDGIGRPQVVLASENAVRLYAYPVTDAKVLAETQLPGTGLRILGLEAARLDGGTGDALLVSVYDETFKRFETRVLRLETGKWLKVAELPFLTRSYQDAKGATALATQQVVDDKTFPLGRIYPLEYKDGRYAQGRPAVALRRADWLFGFNTTTVGGEPAEMYYTTIHALRVQLGKKWWRTADEDYGQTPLRVRWEDRLLEFNPPMAVLSGAEGLEGLFAVRNLAALGGLASPFGLFNRAELARKNWNGLALETAWKADLPGCAQGLAIVSPEAGRRELAVAIRGSADESSVWTFDL